MAIISIPTSAAGVNLSQFANLPRGPLSSLYAGVDLQTYKFPSDLATDPTKSHYVTFKVSQIIPSGYTSTVGEAPISPSPLNLGNAAPLVENAGNALQNTYDNAIAKQNDPNATSVEKIASEYVSATGQATQAALTAIGFQDVKITDVTSATANILRKGLKISPKMTKSVAVVSLYMPDTLTANYDSQYSELSLTSDLGSGMNTIRALNEVLAKSGDVSSGSIKDFAKSVGNVISTDPAALTLALKAAGAIPGVDKILDPQSISTLLLKGQGNAINPQVQMIYKGVSLRSFNLSFVFTPKSLSDSIEIQNIIKTFKQHFLPTLQSSTETSSSSMFFTPPSIFNVNFMINNQENTYLPKYGDCVLKNIDVNYAPNGFAAFDNGAPVQTTLSLAFEEIQAMDSAKIQSGELR